MTIIERKQLAAHQRRVGPQVVGWDNKYLKDYCLPGSSKFNKRFFHSFFDGNNDIINALYENRTDSSFKGKLFDSDIVDTFCNLTSTEQRVLFFNKYNNKGGIYLIQYKDDLSIYYIGRTKNFKNRLNAHLKTKVKDKFHLFANLVGWEKFNFSIVEICDLNTQQERENFYLKKYLPLLNTVFKSNFSGRSAQIYDTLYNKLKAKQENLVHNNKYIGISIYVYTYNNDQISKNFTKYDSINTLSKDINVSRDTIKRYLNTHVPFNNHLFFTDVINDFNLINDLIYEAKKGLALNMTLPKKVLAYNINGEVFHFESKETCARFLNVQSRTITNHIDKWVKGGINGYYLFSKELNNIEKEKLIEVSSMRKTNNCEVWVYDANNLESIYPSFNSMQKAADHFNVDYRSILRHLDTNKATIRNDKLVLFFSKKLDLEYIKGIKVENIKNETIKLWVYKKINNELVLINDNKPTFNSKNIAAKELNISSKTIAKYLDTNKYYNDLLFYSKEL